MCNREISSRRIDCFFPRSSTTIRGRSPGGGSYQPPPPPDRPRYEKCPDRARVNEGDQLVSSDCDHSIIIFLCWSHMRTPGGKGWRWADRQRWPSGAAARPPAPGTGQSASPLCWKAANLYCRSSYVLTHLLFTWLFYYYLANPLSQLTRFSNTDKCSEFNCVFFLS